MKQFILSLCVATSLVAMVGCSSAPEAESTGPRHTTSRAILRAGQAAAAGVALATEAASSAVESVIDGSGDTTRKATEATGYGLRKAADAVESVGR